MKYKFICPIFRDEIFLFTADIEKLNKFCPEIEIATNQNGAFYEIRNKSTDVTGLLVWVDKSDNYNTMVHECLHLVRAVFKNHGVPFNSKNDEIIAYYQNYWVRTFWHKMSKEIKE